MAFTPSPAFVSVTPSDPTAQSPANVFVMAGLGAAATPFVITPQSTGRIFVVVTGVVVSGTSADTVTLELMQGTGSAPANNAAVTGTQIGTQPAWISLTGNLQTYFCLTGVITGAALGNISSGGTTAPTQIWLDIAFKSSGTHSVQPTKLTCTAIEF